MIFWIVISMAGKENDIRPGQVLERNNKLYLVASTMHTQPGKGGAHVQVEMKDIKTGTKNYDLSVLMQI